jgi:co-chaperonin GroES (HSP10)
VTQILQQSGVRVGERKSYNGIPAGTQLRPLRDMIVVRPLDYVPSQIIAVAGVEDPPLRGIVIAVGPGDYHRQYNADRSKSWFSKVRTPCDVKVGDEVEIEVHARDRVMIDGIQHIICSEKHVCGVVE